MTPLPVVSPSQISTFRACQRKWAWDKLDGIRSPGTKSTALGTQVHKVLEDYIDGKGLTFDPVDSLPGEIAQAGLHLIPVDSIRQSGGTEVALSFSTASATYRGFADFYYREGPSVTIGDHKTTSDMRWAKTADMLRVDPQAVIYGSWAVREFRVPTVAFSWIYYQTKKPHKAREVSLTLNREYLDQELAKIDLTAWEIGGIRNRVKTALELPPSPGACDDFGGCPYKRNCNLTAAQTRSVMFSKIQLPPRKKAGDMGIIEDLVKKKKEKAVSVSTSEGEGFVFPSPATDPPDINPPEWEEHVSSLDEPLYGEVVPPPPVVQSVGPKKRGPKPKEVQGPKEVKAQETPKPQEPRAVLKSFTLYVDCTPMMSPNFMIVDCSLLIAKTHQKMLEDHDILDYSLVDYGKGAGMFIDAFKGILAEAVPDIVDLVISTRCRETHLVLSHLMAMCDILVISTK